MSKYRRISNNMELKEKEKKKSKNNIEQQRPSYLDTKSLMEKLGIKIANEEIYQNKNSLYNNPKQLKNDNININITTNLINEDNSNANNFKSKSQKKRNKNDNHNKRKNQASSYEKRIIKKNVENKINIKKEKEAYIKKNIKENNDKNENNENAPRKKALKKEFNKMISKKENKINNNNNNNSNNSNIATNKKYNKMKSLNEEIKISQFKRNKEQDEIKNTPSIKNVKDKSTNNISSISNKNINYDDSKTNELDQYFRRSIKIKIIDNKNKKEIKEEIKEEKEKKNNDEKQKKFRKNKAISVDKIISDKKIFNFKSKKNQTKKNKHTDSSNDSKQNSESDYTVTSDSEESSDNKSEHSDTTPNENDIIRSNKKHLTEIASQKDEKNKAESEKEIIRANKKHLTEVAGQDQANNINKKNTLKDNENADNDKKFVNKRYLRRRSMDNPLMREKFELLMTDMLLKQNGGNSLFLKNYEKGHLYEKEIDLLIKNQNIKKKLKICSCTKAGCSGPGIVKTNQDAFFIKDNFLKNNIYLGVCDGHGEKGELVSRYVTNKLPDYIKDLSNENITNAFKKINNEIYNNKSIESNMSGTTVVSLIITTEKIISVNLGDSRAAIFKYENGLYYCKNLSRDHKPSEPDENKRIINNNGRIKKCYDEDLKKYLGPDRVWLKNKEEPGLAMTRSIGDKIAHTVGVTDEPEFKNFEYDGTEKFIIIASDGIWEYLHGDDCIKIVRPFYEENKDCEEAALALVKESFRKWKRKEIAIDDITVIVVFFDE